MRTQVLAMRHLPLSVAELDWRLWPDPYVYIGRGGPWGNPFRIGKDGNRAEVIEKFRHWLYSGGPAYELSAVDELKGKTLVCWCKPLDCHGDVLAELAES